MPVNQEWITFVDRRDGVVISEPLLSLSTTVSSCTGRDLERVAWACPACQALRCG